MKIKTMSRGEILQKMTDTVEAVCEAYKSDFYEYDVQTISEMKPYDERIWLVRDTGTYMPMDPEMVKMMITCSRYTKAARIQKSASGEWFEYEPLKPEDLERWIQDREENYLMQVYDELLAGTIFCSMDHDDLMVPRLMAENNTIYCRKASSPADMPMEISEMSLESLKYVISELMVQSPCSILKNFEKRDNNTIWS